MASSRFVVVRGTAAFQENPRIPREEYPRRPIPFILSMRPTIIRISLRSRPWNARLIDNLVKCAKRNIFFACLMTVGRYNLEFITARRGVREEPRGEEECIQTKDRATRTTSEPWRRNGKMVGQGEKGEVRTRGAVMYN